jgi:hypothetical protein
VPSVTLMAVWSSITYAGPAISAAREISATYGFTYFTGLEAHSTALAKVMNALN